MEDSRISVFRGAPPGSKRVERDQIYKPNFKDLLRVSRWKGADVAGSSRTGNPDSLETLRRHRVLESQRKAEIRSQRKKSELTSSHIRIGHRDAGLVRTLSTSTQQRVVSHARRLTTIRRVGDRARVPLYVETGVSRYWDTSGTRSGSSLSSISSVDRATCQVLGTTIEERLDKQGSVVVKEEQGQMCSECEKTQDELQDLIFPSSEIETFLKGILYILGKNNDFEKDKLIQLWMAGGLIENEPMEAIGIEYFEKLVSEGYILCSKANPLYKVNIEKLNTELDMILQKSYCFRLESTSQNNAASTETLYAAVVGDEIDEKVFKMLRRFNKLRALLFLGNYGSRLQQVPRDLFLYFAGLQALDLSGTHIKELPSSAEKMVHLRYLDLSWTFIELLPKRIDRFEKLQTLKLKGCTRLQRLPREMKRLIELRHLELDVLGQLVSFPEGVGALVKLRTLSAFPVGAEEGFRISELRHLNNLMGEFCVANLENVQSAEEAEQASLADKRNIKKLELRWSSDYECEEAKIEDELILENLSPCSDLEEIQIVHYHGTKLPTWISSVSFHKLFSIILYKCEHVCVLPSLEKLPSLHTLELIGLNSVMKMEFALPKLKKLCIDEMLSLETWTEAEEGDFLCLEELSIKDCPKLRELPSLVYLPSVKYLEVSGCAKLAFWSEKKLSSSLRKLVVEDCPLMEERCSEQGGQDWHKIQHVPTIWIDQVEIQSREDDKKEPCVE